MLSSIYLTGDQLDTQQFSGQVTAPDWRSLAVNKLHRHGVKVINPLELAYSIHDRTEELVTEEVEMRVRRALELIDQSDAVLANLTRSSYATAMEMFYAHRSGKLVTVIGQSPFSPWVLSHSQARFNAVDDAIDFILGEQPHSPLHWALQYEAQLSERYEQLPPPGEADYKFIGGQLPVLALAPHATAYWREGEFEEADSFTGSMAALINRTSGCHSMLSNYCCVADPCWYTQTPLRRAFTDVVKAGQIACVVMLLGSSWHEAPGLQLTAYAPVAKTAEDYTARLKQKLGALEQVVTDVNSDLYVLPLVRFATTELQVPVVVLKMHKRYRMPRLQSEQFLQIVGLISEFMTETGTELVRSRG
jgi:nucleoside 2-deoxyribosyltransferase